VFDGLVIEGSWNSRWSSSTDLWMSRCSAGGKSCSIRVSVMASFLLGRGLEKIIEETSNPPFDVVTDLANHFDVLTGRIRQVPVRYRLPGYTGHASPQPIVTMTSAWSPIWSVSFRGASLEMSMPFSFIT